MNQKLVIFTVFTAFFIVLSASVAAGIPQKAQATKQYTVGLSAQLENVSQQIGRYVPKPGYQFVNVKCTINDENAPGLQVGMNDWQLHVYNTAPTRVRVANVYTPDVTATHATGVWIGPSMFRQTGFHNDTLYAGKSASGNIIYQVPKNAQITFITYTPQYPYSLANWRFAALFLDAPYYSSSLRTSIRHP
jgi:hypothetical protein